MSKQHLAEQLVREALSHNISLPDIIKTWQQQTSNPKKKILGEATRSFSATNVLVYLGTLIIVLGLFIFLHEYWEYTSVLIKILLTFGVGIAAFMAGIICCPDKSMQTASGALLLASALLIPVGIHTIFISAGFSVGSLYLQSIISILLFLVYATVGVIFQRALLTFFSIVYGTWFIWVFVFWLKEQHWVMWNEIFIGNYFLILLGLIYIILAHSFRYSTQRVLGGTLYGFGALALLFGAYNNGNWLYIAKSIALQYPLHTLIWQYASPALAALLILLSIPYKSKALLTFGTLFIMIFMIVMADRYFSHSLGWPIAVIIVGCALILMGYISFYLKKRFM